MDPDSSLSPALNNLSLKESENPWKEEESTKQPETSTSEPRPVLSDDVTSPTAAEVDRPIPKTVAPDADILNEFDPLVDREELEARDAWVHAESHPPPAVAPPSPPPKTPPRVPTPPTKSPPTLAEASRSGNEASYRDSRDLVPQISTPSTPNSFTAAQAQAAEATQQEPLFDFQRFLDQLKSKSAEPVSKYLRSFLSNFSKRNFPVNDQIKLITDFLNFISARMRECDVWKHGSDIEFDMAMEAMEKLVMNRLYDFTFSPQIAISIPPRPVLTDDLERDRILEQRISLFGWIREEHLDVPVSNSSRGFINFAQQELLKINHFKAPRDKLICLLNCCKVIFGLIRHIKSDEGADAFLPILIFVVLKANPQHMLSNVEYINRFRNPNKLQSEAGYYLSSLMGAISFIETMDHTSLSNISKDEFERKVEDAIQSLPRTPEPSPRIMEPTTPAAPGNVQSVTSPHAGEESAQPLSLPAPAQSLADDTRRFIQRTGDTLSKPLGTISRIFNEALDSAEGKLTGLPGPFAPLELGREARREEAHQPQTPMGVGPSGQQVGAYNPPIQTPYKARVRPTPPPSNAGTPNTASARSTGWPHSVVDASPGPASSPSVAAARQRFAENTPHVSRTPTPALDIAGMQAEIDRVHNQQTEASMSTLRQIFPTTDSEVIAWVLEANDGDVGKSIEALLDISGAG